MADKFKMPSKEDRLARFWQLKKAIDRANLKIAPLRKTHDDFVNESREKAKAMHDKILAVEVEPGLGLQEAQMDHADLARSLGNNVGEDPDAAKA